MGRLGFSQVDVDEMELWVIAAHITGGEPADDAALDDEDPTGDGVPMSEDAWRRQSQSLIRQRLAAASTASSPSPDGGFSTIPGGDADG